MTARKIVLIVMGVAAAAALLAAVFVGGILGDRQTVDVSVNLVFTNGSAWRVSAASYVDSSGQKIYLLDPYDSKNLVPHLIA